MYFRDRTSAGKALARRLAELELVHPVVYGVARGGVAVAAVVADELKCELDVVAPRKLPHPANSEVAIGAVSEDGQVLLDDEAVAFYGIAPEYVAKAGDAAATESRRRVAHYRGSRTPVVATGRDAVLVDDGVATGFTLMAAAYTVRAHKPRRLIIAIPVGPRPLPPQLTRLADVSIVLTQPEPFYAVGQAYTHFDQVDDDAVVRLLDGAAPAGTIPPYANQ